MLHNAEMYLSMATKKEQGVETIQSQPGLKNLCTFLKQSGSMRHEVKTFNRDNAYLHADSSH